ncbi:DUF2809 domain-containing protein [Paenibacillus sp. T1]|uniref:DUF2809 domain-containing protein n=1 Tax=Paenibacillus glycinis TaxID=2697035 RepID=A0ABW9XIS2_9BACL|nr:DUF2809 domain-containing protein [Paenibacillus glycinis]
MVQRSRPSGSRTGLRFGYFLAAAASVVLGLCSRRFAASLPEWVADQAGDALWAAMIYYGCRLLRPGRLPSFAAIAAVLFCFAVECSQLYQADWINAIRRTALGGLVLGQGFLAVDLLRYAAGIGMALLLDGLIFARRSGNSQGRSDDADLVRRADPLKGTGRASRHDGEDRQGAGRP